jgi:RNA polymerase sigma factor (sigma-70 family)
MAEAMTASAPEPRTEELYAQHGRLVSGLCQALLRDRAEAEDAAQQTFLAAHRALLNGSSPREPAAWLATIARNECWARIRGRMREPLPTAEVEAVSTSGDPVTEAIRRADLAALWHAIAELPRPQRDAFLLREFAGLSYEELAAALAVTGPAVESLLFRARQGLRGRLQTAYAAVRGASWIEALSRLLSGASISAVPVAAKAVVVAGVGAAVATGGAVVAPHMFDHQRAPRHRTVVAATRPEPAVPALVLATPARAPVARHFIAAAAPAAQGDEQASSEAGSGSSGSGDGQRAAGTEDASRIQPLTAQRESRDASGGDSQVSGGGDSGDGGATQPAGDNGGVTVPAPNPPLMVIGAPVDTPPAGDD